jgi:HD superfamily phosphohydrolase
MNSSLSISLELLQEIAEKLAAMYLDKYIDELNTNMVCRLKSKEINDALWGTVLLAEAEVAVLDSPLLQRLRFLRQMGTAHWVYPGAVHTRFEHAIGALHQTQKLIDALNAQSRQFDEKILVSKQDAQLLRLSSLFSHVGCFAFMDCLALELEAHPKFTEVKRDFAIKSGPQGFGADPSFSQLLAYYIVKSPAVKALLLILVKKRWLQIDQLSEEEAVELAAHKISLTIIGRRLDEYRPQLQEIVSGPFDSSTLDALVRDAQFSGIPSVLDIRRLVQKLAVGQFFLTELPDWINGSLVFNEEERNRSPRIWIFGVPIGSASILNELQLAQLLVTTKVRRHPKVLAIEEMLRSVVRILAAIAPVKDLLEFLYSMPEDVLVSMNTSALKDFLIRDASVHLGDEEQFQINLACEILKNIRERRISVRALQLSDAVIGADDPDAVGINRFYSELRHPQRGPELLVKVCDEVAAVLKVANLPEMPKAALSAWVNLRNLPSIAAEPRVGRAIVLPPIKRPCMLRQSWEGSDNWVDQYLRGQPTLYVFTTSELADVVYVAVERLVDRLFKAELPSGTLETSKRKKQVLQELKLKTTKPGFWHGHAWHMRPRARIWGAADIGKRIQQVVLKLSKVSSIPTLGRNDVRENIYRWLEQFENDNDIACALAMLENFKIIDRHMTTEAFNTLFSKHPNFKGAYAVSLGDPKDGGVIQGYFAADHSQVIKVVTLDQWARESEDRALIFVDDCCGSGSQVCDILAAWLGRDDLREPLGEDRAPLPPEVQERLLKTEIMFLFITAWAAGVEKIRERLKLLGMNGVVFPYLSDDSIPFVESTLLEIGKAQSEVDAFIKRCQMIGEEILRSKNVDPEKIDKRKFGYGNRGMLLSTLVNVPTQTTTLIWEDGEVDGVHWEAILPRRKKN